MVKSQKRFGAAVKVISKLHSGAGGGGVVNFFIKNSHFLIQASIYFQKVSKTFGMLVQDSNATCPVEINTDYLLV